MLSLRLDRIKTNDRKHTTMCRIWIQIREEEKPQCSLSLSSTKREPNVYVELNTDR